MGNGDAVSGGRFSGSINVLSIILSASVVLYKIEKTIKLTTGFLFTFKASPTGLAQRVTPKY